MFDRMVERALLNFGNPYRILKAFEKGRRGEDICVVALGGSITQRFHASSIEKCYASLIGAWWKENFPQSNVNFVNAGIGSTGSLIGIHRLQRDVLDFNPDFVVVEYSVNDFARRNIDAKETYANVIHRLLDFGCAVLSLDMTTTSDRNTQYLHLPIAKYYDVPFVSFCDAVTPEWTENESLKTKWEADGTHPTDEGHKLVADLVCDYLNKLLPLNINDYAESEVKEPYFTEDFQKASIYYIDDLVPEQMGCFEKGKTYSTKMEYGWKTTTNGDPLVFKFENCKKMFVLIERTNSGKGGKAIGDVNGRKTEFDSHFEDGWGIYANSTLVFESDKPEDVTFTLTPALEEDKEFALIAIMVS